MTSVNKHREMWLVGAAVLALWPCTWIALWGFSFLILPLIILLLDFYGLVSSETHLFMLRALRDPLFTLDGLLWLGAPASAPSLVMAALWIHVCIKYPNNKSANSAPKEEVG